MQAKAQAIMKEKGTLTVTKTHVLNWLCSFSRCNWFIWRHGAVTCVRNSGRTPEIHGAFIRGSTQNRGWPTQTQTPKTCTCILARSLFYGPFISPCVGVGSQNPSFSVFRAKTLFSQVFSILQGGGSTPSFNSRQLICLDRPRPHTN
jgi:hypothetical protein